MPQPAMIVMELRDQEDVLTGHNVITIPSGGEPRNAGRELVNLILTQEGRDSLTAQGFREVMPEFHPGTSYKQLSREAQGNKIPNVYRLGYTCWEYQNTNSMRRGLPLHEHHF